ncbi:hypothetical protein LJC63_02055 [Ruminococcaceae bacterium OttesenSCG-928-L11]|nr:hypothetical protein [Ruminococcaceae bacterium OttesenSCG-928-L11]
MDKRELVRRFFEDDDYRSVAAQICEPEMEHAIKAYLLDQYYRQYDFAALDFSRLTSCLNINESEMLKEVLFRGLDTFAENYFDEFLKMEEYVIRVYECLPDRFSPKEFVGPTGLRHVELLRQYLNECYKNERKAALWNDRFPEIFTDVRRRAPFVVVFLLMMLDKEQHKTSPATQLDMEPLSMLVRCGYEYLFVDDFDEFDSVPFAIRSAVAEIAAQNKFYLREDHESFHGFAVNFMYNGVHEEVLRIICTGDRALRSIFLERLEYILSPGTMLFMNDPRYLTRLIDKIPQKCMADLEPEWKRVLVAAERFER